MQWFVGSRFMRSNDGLIGEMRIWVFLRRNDKSNTTFQEERKGITNLPSQLPRDKTVTPSLTELTVGLEWVQNGKCYLNGGKFYWRTNLVANNKFRNHFDSSLYNISKRWVPFWGESPACYQSCHAVSRANMRLPHLQFYDKKIWLQNIYSNPSFQTNKNHKFLIIKL